ncbi:Hsp70 family protein [Microbispora rosea]|uniref:Hsp70 family protein n=1 Tax=Microbispora rosea TaxID=58117 RepID=UPI003D8F6EED
MKRQKVVAAIDFGTHGTGYAWCVIDDTNKDIRSRKIYWRNQWPSQPVAYPKNLTALLLDQDQNVLSWGYDAKRRWTSIRKKSERDEIFYAQSFKMELTGEENNPASAIVGSANNTHVLITKYLELIYVAALEEITKSGYVEDEIRWCLTIPAIWNDYQKQVMRELAIRAGLPSDDKRLLLALEPEVAAYYARVSGVRTVGMSGKRANLMSPGSRFVVVDCGGGTVDITAYRTDANNNLVEVGNDWGGKYGSEYVNKEFVMRVLQSRFGSYDVLQVIKEECPIDLLKVVDAWENEKLHVTAEQKDDIYLPLPAAIDRLISDEVRTRIAEIQDGVSDAIVVTAEEARAAFDGVIPNILELVDKALEEMRLQRRNSRGEEILLLVGGFGASPYLQERLRAHVEGRGQVVVPGDPKVAVLLGAVHYAYSPQTTARKTKLTYGCSTSMTFREGIDPASRRFLPPDGVPRCRGRFSVFVRARDLVPVDKEIRHNYFPVYPDQSSLRIDVYSTPALRPIYVEDEGSRHIGSLSIDLSRVMHLAQNERGVAVFMRFGATQIRVRAQVINTGEAIEADLNFDPTY